MRKKERKAKRASKDSDALAKLSKGASGAAAAAYNLVPDLPVLERSGTALLVACAGAYILFMAYVLVVTPPIEIKSSYSEAPLQKNSAFALTPGEKYSYEIPVQGTVRGLDYEVWTTAGCDGWMVSESYGVDSQLLCIGKDGRLASGAAGGQYDSGYGNQSLFFFSPWMLAASGNFSWKTETVVSTLGAEIKSTTYYASKGEKTVGGRKTYPVELRVNSETATPDMVMYVDAEKRVLVMAEGANATVRLASAPFALDWNAGAQN